MNINKLYKWINENKHRVFSWGDADCCTFTCDFVKHMVDIDPAEKHRGQYDSEIGAKRAIVEFGSIEDSFDAHFNRVPFNHAMRGDIVLYNTKRGVTMGIIWSGGAFTIGEESCTVVPVTSDMVTAVWRIEE